MLTRLTAGSHTVLPHGRLVFEPGGWRLMLMGMLRTPRPGERIDVQLEFAGGGRADCTWRCARCGKSAVVGNDNDTLVGCM
ncbi:MAG TPA: copper chaperone PCu(A)C [Gammaproteobacteria bacterium]|nr:copper chaperone PCu(A)C [Gammaproteobacteria bacterium]